MKTREIMNEILQIIALSSYKIIKEKICRHSAASFLNTLSVSFAELFSWWCPVVDVRKSSTWTGSSRQVRLPRGQSRRPHSSNAFCSVYLRPENFCTRSSQVQMRVANPFSSTPIFSCEASLWKLYTQRFFIRSIFLDVSTEVNFQSFKKPRVCF